MEMDLSPKEAQKLFEGEGGSYHAWSSAVLGEAKVGAGRLVLHPHGFTLPHYSDAPKLGYVVQGTRGIVGITLPEKSEEVVLKLKKGDVIPVPLGATSWWYNEGDSELTIILLGETSKAYVPGQFAYLLLTGTLGILGAFSTGFISKTYDITEEEATKLGKSQTGSLIVKLKEGIHPPPSDDCIANKFVYNIGGAVPDIHVQNGGTLSKLTMTKFPFLEQAGLSANLLQLNANAMCSPMYAADATVQVFYVAKGSGKVQIVGANGERALDTKVEAGQLFVVPRLHVVAEVAGDGGIELFSMTTSSKPMFKELGGKESIWKTLFPEVLHSSLNVGGELGTHLVSKIEESTIIIPPKY